MAEYLKKFLDQQGVSTLWSKVAEKVSAEVAAEKARAEGEEAKIALAAKKAQDEVDALETYVGLIPNGEDGNPVAASVVAYVNKKTEGIATNAALGELQATVSGHTDAIALLNGDDKTEGSVAYAAATAVAKIVDGANDKYDTLREIAEWILNDTTGAADMANDIAALQTQMDGIGDSTVVARIAAEIEAALKVEGVDKYALATELNALADRVKALEDADLINRVADLEGKFDGDDSVASLIAAAKQEAIEAAGTNAKNYADGLAINYATAEQGALAASALQKADIATGSANGTISVEGTDVAVYGLGSAAYTDASAYDAAGTAASAVTAAEERIKAYIEGRALTTAEIEAAIAAASTQG